MARDSDLEQELADIAALTERLRVHYNAYFLGLEKNAPMNLRDQLERRIRTSILNDEGKAFYKFRFQAAVSRYRTMSVYWDRILRDLETGRTSRAKLRAEKGYGAAAVENIETPRMRRIREAAAKNAAGADGGDGGDGGDGTAGTQSGSADGRASLYEQFIQARQSVGLPTEGITPEGFARTLEKQKQIHTANPEIRDVEFSVKVKEGRVVVVARPVK